MSVNHIGSSHNTELTKQAEKPEIEKSADEALVSHCREEGLPHEELSYEDELIINQLQEETIKYAPAQESVSNECSVTESKYTHTPEPLLGEYPMPTSSPIDYDLPVNTSNQKRPSPETLITIKNTSEELSIEENQTNILNSFDIVENTVFDAFENGDIVVCFPDGRNPIRIDCEGNLKELNAYIETRDNGSISTISYYNENEYGNNSRRIIYYNDNGTVCGSVLKIYNNNGQEILSEQFHASGLADNCTEREYNSEGRVIQETKTKFFYDSEDELVSKSEEYFKYGILIRNSKTSYAKDGENTVKITLKYNGSGILLGRAEEVIDKNGETISCIDSLQISNELRELGYNFTKEQVLEICSLCLQFPDLSADDIAYAVSMGYDKYLYNIADYGGLEYIKEGKATSFIMHDYNKLITAIKNKDSVEEVFCPEISDTQTALMQLNIGEVCTIGGKVYIHNGFEMERINLSRKKYLGLFPPVSRYSINQNESGDCYLLATLYSMETNPIAYANLLRCFSENNDGSVEVKLYNKTSFFENLLGIKRGTNVTFTIPAGKKMDDFYTPSDEGQKYADACEGIRALEYLYGFNVINENIDVLFDELNEAIERGDEDEILSLNERITEVTDKAEKAKGTGGHPDETFHAFGYSGTQSFSVGNIEDGITEKMYVGGTSPLSITSQLSDIGESESHAYSIRPFYDKNGDLKFEVTNPWNTNYSTILNKDEVNGTFLFIFSIKTDGIIPTAR